MPLIHYEKLQTNPSTFDVLGIHDAYTSISTFLIMAHFRRNPIGDLVINFDTKLHSKLVSAIGSKLKNSF
jgi:hypothetical protein